MCESEKWKWSRSVLSDSSRPHGLQPTRLLCPCDFLGKSTGVAYKLLIIGFHKWPWETPYFHFISLHNLALCFFQFQFNVFWGFFFCCTMWHVGSEFPDRDRTQAPCLGRAESWPLDPQGSPSSMYLLPDFTARKLAQLTECPLKTYSSPTGSSGLFLLQHIILKSVSPSPGTSFWSMLAHSNPSPLSATQRSLSGNHLGIFTFLCIYFYYMFLINVCFKKLKKHHRPLCEKQVAFPPRALALPWGEWALQGFVCPSRDPSASAQSPHLFKTTQIAAYDAHCSAHCFLSLNNPFLKLFPIRIFISHLTN